jgi:importin subunit beta-1
MQIVCEATQSASTDTQVAAFECLVRIVSLYYEKMHFYMEKALCQLTVGNMTSTNEQVYFYWLIKGCSSSCRVLVDGL